MIVELRQKSQVTIPSEYVKQLSLNAGDKFEAIVKNGVLMLIPVAVYPKSYVEELKSELSLLKKGMNSGRSPVFHNVDDMFASLDEE